jgi:uncharacterized coiled-coil protein SlyX
MSDEKMTDLEIRITFLEDNLQTLDKVVQQLGSSLDAMRHELLELKDSQSTMLKGGEGEMSSTERMLNEKPPHY